MEIFNIEFFNNDNFYNCTFDMKIYINCKRSFDADEKISLKFKYLILDDNDLGNEVNNWELYDLDIQLIQNDNMIDVKVPTNKCLNTENITQNMHFLIVGLFYEDKLVNKCSYNLSYSYNNNNIDRDIAYQNPLCTQFDIVLKTKKKIYNNLFFSNYNEYPMIINQMNNINENVNFNNDCIIVNNNLNMFKPVDYFRN